MAKIHALPGVSQPDQPLDLQPVPEVVEELVHLLAAAKNGELRAIGVATVRAGREAGSLWVQPPNGNHGHDLASAISILHHRYFASLVMTSRERPTKEPA